MKASASEHLVDPLPGDLQELGHLVERHTGLAPTAKLLTQLGPADVEQDLGGLDLAVRVGDVGEKLKGLGGLGEHVKRLLTNQHDVKELLTR